MGRRSSLPEPRATGSQRGGGHRDAPGASAPAPVSALSPSSRHQPRPESGDSGTDVDRGALGPLRTGSPTPKLAGALSPGRACADLVPGSCFRGERSRTTWLCSSADSCGDRAPTGRAEADDKGPVLKEPPGNPPGSSRTRSQGPGVPSTRANTVPQSPRTARSNGSALRT